jgi:hypothetical protein
VGAGAGTQRKFNQGSIDCKTIFLKKACTNTGKTSRFFGKEFLNYNYQWNILEAITDPREM